LLKLLKDLDAYTPKQDTFKELCTSIQKVLDLFTEIPTNTESDTPKDLPFKVTKCIYEEVFEKSDEEDLMHFKNGIKRRLFFDTLKIVFDFNRHVWAKTSVT
jgi:hypothetical protein